MAPIGISADRRLRLDICRAANNGLLEACTAYPQRFVMAAAPPFPDAAAAHAELARIASDASLRAVQIVAQTTGYWPDPGLDDIFRLAAGTRLPNHLPPAAGIADSSTDSDHNSFLPR